MSSWEEPGFGAWQQRSEVLPTDDVTVRVALPTSADGRWMRWMQADSESATIQGVEFNTATIRDRAVFVAEVAECPVGFCLAMTGRSGSDPLFVQMVAVVPAARRRGAGLALLRAAAASEPDRDIVMATIDGNTAARRMNEQFARSLGLAIRRVPIRTYRRSEMGFGEGEKHRPWLIERDSTAGAAR